jgi:hypothetical protein
MENTSPKSFVPKGSRYKTITEKSVVFLASKRLKNLILSDTLELWTYVREKELGWVSVLAKIKEDALLKYNILNMGRDEVSRIRRSSKKRFKHGAIGGSS